MKNTWVWVALAAVAAVFLLKRKDSLPPTEDQGDFVPSGDFTVTIS